MDWIVPGVAKSWTWLSKFHFTSNKIKVDLPFMRLVSSPWLVWQPHSKKSSGTCPFLLSPLSGLSVTLRPTFQAEDEGVIRWMGEEPWMLMVGVVESLSRVRLFATPWTAVHQASLSLTISWFLPKFMSTESVMPSNHLILCCPLLLLPCFPASGSFPVSQLFESDGWSIEASASVLPVSIQGWFSLGLTGLILLSKRLSKVFFSTTIWKHQVFGSDGYLFSNSCLKFHASL